MTNEFIREARYAVLKSADVMQCLTVSELIELRRIQAKVEEHRAEIGKPPLDCVVVESDWPEYEPTWNAIEARVTGAQPAPIAQDESVRKAWARFSNELHRSPDAPYPGMSEAFEQHFSQSFTDREWRAESATWAAAWKAAKRHEAQAQPAPSIPVGWKLVPIEPTHEMVDAIEEQWVCGSTTGMARREYLAALAAAPKPEGE